MPLIEANAYVCYVQAAGAGGNFGTLDVVHSYFNGTDYETMVTENTLREVCGITRSP
jgi:hypothetical protein